MTRIKLEQAYEPNGLKTRPLVMGGVMIEEIFMPYAMFHQYFPDIAKSETRTVTILQKGKYDLPAGNYGFLEMFCDEPGCDCRRVFFCVVSEKSSRIEAYITYGWEAPSYYRKWLGSDDPHDISELTGPA